MAAVKYYPESELVQKLQDGEYGWLEYVNHHSKEWQDEYAEFCQQNSMTVGEASAEKFVNYKGEELEKALANGDA